MSYSKPSLSTIEHAFSAVVEASGGRVEQTVHYGSRYFARAVAPDVIDFKPKDGFRGGVAVQASVEFAEVQPYLFRLVCKNGAIMARALPGFRLIYSEQPSEEEILTAFRLGIEKYWRPGVFAALVERLAVEDAARKRSLKRQFRRRYGRWPDPVRVVPAPTRAAVPRALAREMARRFQAATSPSSFEAMNAVTSVARDLDSPALQWKLEELGGAVGVGLAAPPFAFEPGASAPLSEAVERAPLGMGQLESPAERDAVGELVGSGVGDRLA